MSVDKTFTSVSGSHMKTALCFGDSNTHGTLPMRALGEFNRYPPEVRWPGVLSAKLDPEWNILEEGHPDEPRFTKTPIEGAHKNGFPALLSALETHRPIDCVVLMLGTNDLKCRYSVTAKDIAFSVEKLVVAIKSSPAGPDSTSPQILLVSPPPILETGVLTEMFQGGAAKSADLAQYYCDVAGRNECAFLDAGTVIKSSTIDGIHFDEDMHPKLGSAIAKLFPSL